MIFCCAHGLVPSAVAIRKASSSKGRKQIHIPTAKQHWELRKFCGSRKTGGDKGGETLVWILKNNNNKVITDMEKEKEKDSSVHLQMTYKRNGDP